MEFDINNLAQLGLVRDIPGFQLPPEGFSLALNGRFDRDGFTSGPWWDDAFTPSVAPYFLMGIKSPVLETWIIYTSLTKAYVFDGTTHSDITRTVGGDYTATLAREWNGCVLGGVPIINNGVDDPQFWAAFSGATALADLTNWPAATTCRIMRAFGPNLVAFDVTKTGTQYGSMVKWSHPADPGGVPSSWDETDETLDAGETDLTDDFGGPILDALQLHDAMIVYKGGATFLMRRVGGPFIFQFDQLFTMSGLLARRCVATTGDGDSHFVATEDDVIVHDGNKLRSICDRRMRSTVFNAIDVTNYRNSFCFANPNAREMWFCYPETGETQPTRALVWNYGAGSREQGVLYEQEVNFQCSTIADLPAGSTAWDTDAEAWDDDNATWDTSERRKVLIGNPADTKVHVLELGDDRDGVASTATLQRSHLGVLGRRHTGEPIVDFRRRKFLRRLWIKAEGTSFNVRVGVAEFPQDSVTWEDAVVFDPSTDDYVDFLCSGSSISVEFSGTGQWKVFGYTLEFAKAGRFP